MSGLESKHIFGQEISCDDGSPKGVSSFFVSSPEPTP